MAMPRKLHRLPPGIRKRYRAGETAAALAQECGVSATTLLKELRRAGVKIYPAGGRRAQGLRDRVTRLWGRGYSYGQIAERVGRTRQRVAQIVGETRGTSEAE